MALQNPLIGVFMNLSEDDREISARRDAFMVGLGPIKGLRIDTRFGGADYGGYDAKAQDLTGINPPPDLYFCSCWPTLRALMDNRNPVDNRTPNNGPTPIVFAGLFDLTAAPGTNYPGGNIFGAISFGANLCRQWPTFLRMMAPNVQRAAVLYDISIGQTNADLAFNVIQNAITTGGLGLGLSKIDVGAKNPDNTDRLKTPAELTAAIQAFATAPGGPGGLIVPANTANARLRQTIIEAAATFKLPAVYPDRLYSVHRTQHEGSCPGGLVARAPSLYWVYVKAGQVAKEFLVNGRFPPAGQEIDISQTDDATADFETVVNLKAAKALGQIGSGPGADILANARDMAAEADLVIELDSRD